MHPPLRGMQCSSDVRNGDDRIQLRNAGRAMSSKSKHEDQTMFRQDEMPEGRIPSAGASPSFV